MRQVVDQFGIARNYSADGSIDPRYTAKITDAQQRGEEWAKLYGPNLSPGRIVDPKWAPRKIVALPALVAYTDLYTDSVAAVEERYDPVLFYTEDRAGILNYPPDTICWQSWHPGYVDYYVYRLGERMRRPRARQFVVGRIQDVAALRDPRLKEWIEANNIELINVADALHGTNDFQKRLETEEKRRR